MTTLSELFETLVELSVSVGPDTPVEFAVCDGDGNLQFVNDVDIEPSSFVPQDSTLSVRHFVLIRAHAHGDPHPMTGRGVAADVDRELQQLTEEDPEG